MSDQSSNENTNWPMNQMILCLLERLESVEQKYLNNKKNIWGLVALLTLIRMTKDESCFINPHQND